jgi:mRNA-degrading endonuclease toxin of MazEF toxin-antitoxin module
MTNLITYKPFTVVYVPFPFVEINKNKNRPAIVLSDDLFQKNNGLVTLLMITSAKHSYFYGDYQLTEISETGLKTIPIVRQKIFTIDLRLVIKALGSIAAYDRMKITEILKQHLGGGTL